jgi:hypothetical protein
MEGKSLGAVICKLAWGSAIYTVEAKKCCEVW